MNVIVCGTRKLKDEPAKLWLFSELSDLNENIGIARVLHGDCSDSPDQWAKEWCEENHIYCEAFPADWETHGKAAGFIRNTIMAEQPFVQICIAVWDGNSNGTRHMIEEAVKHGHWVTIVPAKL